MLETNLILPYLQKIYHNFSYNGVAGAINYHGKSNSGCNIISAFSVI